MSSEREDQMAASPADFDRWRDMHRGHVLTLRCEDGSFHSLTCNACGERVSPVTRGDEG